jgi:2-octaprenyl-6-methoxyphenol hydroxylase
VGGASLLESYQRQRRFDNMAMAAATDTLNKLFSNNITPLRILRKIGLKMVQDIPAARKFFMRQAMGSAGLLPTIVKGGKIPQ